MLSGPRNKIINFTERLIDTYNTLSYGYALDGRSPVEWVRFPADDKPTPEEIEFIQSFGYRMELDGSTRNSTCYYIYKIP